MKEDDIEGLTKEELTQSIISFVACLAAIFDIAVAVYFMRRLVSTPGSIESAQLVASVKSSAYAHFRPASPPLVDAASSDTVAPECKMAAVQPLFSAAVRTSHQVKRVNMMMNAAFALVQSMQPIRQSVYRACVAQSRPSWGFWEKRAKSNKCCWMPAQPLVQQNWRCRNRFLRPLSWPR